MRMRIIGNIGTCVAPITLTAECPDDGIVLWWLWCGVVVFGLCVAVVGVLLLLLLLLLVWWLWCGAVEERVGLFVLGWIVGVAGDGFL